MEQTEGLVILDSEELMRRIRTHAVLADEELARAEAAAKAAPDGMALARDLVESRLLSGFQLQALNDARYEVLRIGNYDILDRLGAGGMGAVFKARHRRMKRVVALKVLSRALAKDESFVRRFQREVETIARLNHPNIVVAYDADEAEVGRYLVMEFVAGQDLASLVAKGGPLDIATAVDCLLQTARGLGYAHDQGIIHRDIKPANLLQDASGVVKVADLGLARLQGLAGVMSEATDSSITRAGGVMGTVDFMSPEQALDSTTIDHRADIYSLGATLHFLLVGQPPFVGTSIMAVLMGHRQSPIPSLAAARKDVPAALDAIYQRMMAKSPDDRQQSMAEVVREMERLAPGLAGAPPAERPAIPGRVATDQTLAMAPASTATSANLRVILVEPSRTQSGIIAKYLKAGGIERVVAAGTGQEALAAVRQEAPHAVVSAQHLPDMTGVRLAQEIRAAAQGGAGPGFVLISSESESADLTALAQLPQTVVLQKPFTPEKLATALKAAAGTARRVARPPRGDLRVLIVDDSAAARSHERTVLAGLGLSRFTEAPDGAQAVAVVARETFDLVVTDYNMPLMNGRDLVAFLRQNPATAKVPIVMVTTEQDPARLDEVRRLGVTAICEKGFPREAVERILDQLGTSS